MGSSMNYKKGKQSMNRMTQGKAKAFAQNIIIKPGKGRYPDCFKILPYSWCPKKDELPEIPINVPQTCKTCQEYLKSKFYQEHFAEKAYEDKLIKIKKEGLPTIIETIM